MKFSNYNICTKIYNENYLYNSFTNSLIKLNDIYFEEIKERNIKLLDELTDNQVNILKNNGIIINNEVDELNMIKNKMKSLLANREILTLTIAPTLNCNFDCYYCFEEHQKGKMSNITKENLLKNIEQEIKNGVKIIKIIWYGGEPLLEIKFIENFINSLIKLKNLSDVKFLFGMITNGYLLNSKVCKTLKKLNIKNIQVTLDGEPNVHNNRRKLKNSNQDTFNVILENLKIAKKENLNVNIRINVDTNNFISNENLLKILQDNNLNNFNIDLGYIENFNILNCSNIIKKDDFFNYRLNFNSQLLKYGFKKSNLFPKQNILFCGAYSEQSFVINWNGDIYKCWSDIGNKKSSIGNININNFKTLENKKYDLNYIFQSKCSNCNILPICSGGCPHLYLKEKNRNCSIYKFKLKEILQEQILKSKEVKNGSYNNGK